MTVTSAIKRRSAEPDAERQRALRRACLGGMAAGLLALLLGSYLVWQELERGREVQRNAILAEAGSVRARLESELNSSLYLGWGMAAFISANPDFNAVQFERVAAMLMRLRPNIRSLAVAPDNVIRFIYPLAGNERALGLRYLDTPGQRESIERLMRDWRPVLNGPIELAQGGIGLINRVPVLVTQPDGRVLYWGLVSVALDTKPILLGAGLEQSSDVEFALRGRDGLGADGEVFFGRERLFSDGDAELLDVVLPGGSWQLAARPRGGWSGLRSSWQFGALLALCVFVAVVLGTMVGILIVDRYQIQQLARHDPLTGVANRLRFDERANEVMAMARRSQRGFVLLNLDLNGFKRINDEFGHAAGDAMLIHVARQLLDCLRETDFLARIGGDEFLALLPDTEPGPALDSLLKRVHVALAKPMHLGADSLTVGTSIGVAAYPADGDSLDALLTAADHAMYAGKNTGLTPSL